MAKITTITNPLTGQPAQVDQLDHTAQQIDDAVSRALPGGAIDLALSTKVNPWLNDNGVFLPGCLVDQRQGYVALPGIPYYDGMWANIVGYFDTYTPVNSGPSYSNGEYATYIVGDKTYYVPRDAGDLGIGFVRGYVGKPYGYTIDRWRFNDGTQNVLLINDGYVTFCSKSASQWKEWSQLIENYKGLIGKTITYSALVRTNTPKCILYYALNSGEEERVEIPSDGEWRLVTTTVVIPDTATNATRFGFQITAGYSGSVDIKAAKLELGTQQTLAHQDSSGNWVLNELPNYADTLARCQRYYYRMSADKAYSVFGTGAYWSGNCMFVIPFHTTMRVVPVFSYSGSFILVGGPSVAAVSNIASDGQNRENSKNCACITVYPEASISVAPYVLQANNDTSAYLEWIAEL